MSIQEPFTKPADGPCESSGCGYHVAIDYSSVTTPSRIFYFTLNQRVCVEILLRAGPAGLLGETVLDLARLNARDFRTVWRPNGRTSAAWGRLVQTVPGARGVYRLALPAEVFRDFFSKTAESAGNSPGEYATIGA